MLLAFLKSKVVADGKSLGDLQKVLKITKSQFFYWVNHPDWYNRPLRKKIEDVFGWPLEELQNKKSYDPGPSAAEVRKAKSNARTKNKYPEGSFGRAVYDYLFKNNMNMLELAAKCETYPSMIPQVAKGKMRMTIEVYQKLCELSDSFILFFPWTFAPKTPDYDRRLRLLVQNEIKTQDEIENDWPLLRGPIAIENYLSQSKGEIVHLPDYNNRPTQRETNSWSYAKQVLRKRLGFTPENQVTPLPKTYYSEILRRSRITNHQIEVLSKGDLQLVLSMSPVSDAVMMFTGASWKDGYIDCPAIVEDYQEALRYGLALAKGEVD